MTSFAKKPLFAACLAAAMFASWPGGAVAVPIAATGAPGVVAADPDGVLSLSTSATVEVPNDWISVQFSVTKEGADSAAVQAALKSALAAALEQANRVAKPDGHVEVQGGGFSLQPQFDDKGRVAGWNGSTELNVQGRDMATIAELAGRISTMTVASLGYSVSRAAREKVEGDVAAQAIARFRAKAGDYAKAFGYAGYSVREVNVQTEGGSTNPPRPMMMRAMAAPAGDALPVGAGTGNVTANVNGSVQLK